EWFDDVEFEPYAEEWQTVNGVELVLVDWTDNDGTFSEAMIYVDGQLINVYGTITPETMLTIVAHLLS
ncbi:MAG: hypothetical protein GY943_38295, partial [Chloroflexi bacterium]|nr:hypothetical protein [Chloroflexota bacterium]